MSEDPSQLRRRLETPDAGKEGRTGCMMWGAALGIIVGIMFALYGLPPILKSIYGEKTVPARETYEGDAKQIRVVWQGKEDGMTVVVLDILSNKTWAPEPDDFQLEYKGSEDWIEAEPPDPADPRTSLQMPLGERRELILRFRTPGDFDAERLHLTIPRVRFDLPPEGVQ